MILSRQVYSFVLEYYNKSIGLVFGMPQISTQKYSQRFAQLHCVCISFIHHIKNKQTRISLLM